MAKKGKKSSFCTPKVVQVGDTAYAETAVKISVTAEDILEGVPGDAESCAIALAVGRTIPGYDGYITVGGAEITVGTFERPEGEEKKLDKFLDAFVKKFDNFKEDEDDTAREKAIKAGKIRPFSFVLKLREKIGEVPQLC